MDTNWAAEHLQTIRTLMERSALYRRALAPISTFVGGVGIVAAVVGWRTGIRTAGIFAIYWMAVGLIVVAGALLLVRRQAIKHGEIFWSPPTRRVAQAMAPALLLIAIFGSLVAAFYQEHQPNEFWIFNWLIVAWTVLYGLSLHAAGFFMPRGIRLFGWSFVFAGLVLVALLLFSNRIGTLLYNSNNAPCILMGLFFGVSHLAYGVYLYFTEPRKNEA